MHHRLVHFAVWLVANYHKRPHHNVLFMQAYLQNLVLPQYMILTFGWYRRFWWKFEPTGSCTPQQIEMVLASTLGPIDDFLVEETSVLSQPTTSGIVGIYIIVYCQYELLFCVDR